MAKAVILACSVIAIAGSVFFFARRDPPESAPDPIGSESPRVPSLPATSSRPTMQEAPLVPAVADGELAHPAPTPLELYLAILDEDLDDSPAFAIESRERLIEVFAAMVEESSAPRSAIESLIAAMEFTPSTPLGNIARHEAGAALSTILLPEGGIHTPESRQLHALCAETMVKSHHPAIQQMMAHGLILSGNCTPAPVADRRRIEEGIELGVVADFPGRLWSVGRVTEDAFLRAVAICNLPQTRDQAVLDEAARFALDSDSADTISIVRSFFPLVLAEEDGWRFEAVHGDADISTVPDSRSKLVDRILQRASRPGTEMDVIQVLIGTLVDMGEPRRVHDLRKLIRVSDHSPAALAALDRQLLAYPLPD